MKLEYPGLTESSGLSRMLPSGPVEKLAIHDASGRVVSGAVKFKLGSPVVVIPFAWPTIDDDDDDGEVVATAWKSK